MPIAFGSTPITSVSRGSNAIASATLERLGFPGQTASVFSAVSPPDAPTNVAITVEEDFAPSDITGLQLWLDASDASTLYDATTGGSLVAADGGVARWEDKSGNDNHATQATAANRPVRRAAVVNAKDVLEFDGSNDGLSVNSIVDTFGGSNSPFSVFAVAKTDVTNATQDLLSSANSGNDYQNVRCAWNTGSQKPGLYREGPAFTDSKGIIGGTSLGTNTRLVSYLFEASDGTLFVDGSSDATATDLSQGSTLSLNTVAIGFLPRLNPAVYFNGDVCEVLVYDTALSGTDRTAVENYLLAKWGIT